MRLQARLLLLPALSGCSTSIVRAATVRVGAARMTTEFSHVASARLASCIKCVAPPEHLKIIIEPWGFMEGLRNRIYIRSAQEQLYRSLHAPLVREWLQGDISVV